MHISPETDQLHTLLGRIKHATAVVASPAQSFTTFASFDNDNGANPY